MKADTIRRGAVAALILAGTETAAVACSCPRPLNDAEERASAEEISKGAVALVEVEVISPFGPRRGSGELMRVHRTLAGSAAPMFRLLRQRQPNSALCDNLYSPGSRAFVVLYPAASDGIVGDQLYVEGGVCTSALMRSLPILRQALVEAINRNAMSVGSLQMTAPATCGGPPMAFDGRERQ